MKNNVLKKGLVCALIVLFVSIITMPLAGSLSVERCVSTKEQICKSNLGNDTTPPVTTIYFDPPYPDGENGWYVSDVTVTLNAIDDMSGVDTTYYSINSVPWEVYDTPFRLHWDMLYHIVYFSVDNAGNMEFPKLSRLKLDQTPPETSLKWETYKYLGKLYVKGILVATDATSGMRDWVDFYIHDGLHERVVFWLWPTYEFTIEWHKAFLSVTFGCTDWAGNQAFESINGSDVKSYSYSQSSSQQFTTPLLFQILQRVINIR